MSLADAFAFYPVQTFAALVVVALVAGSVLAVALSSMSRRDVVEIALCFAAFAAFVAGLTGDGPVWLAVVGLVVVVFLDEVTHMFGEGA